MTLKSPFPWFGGKSKVARIVWDRFGDVPNYVEPFFGSGAILLGRPSKPQIETINDKDYFVANFWRAVKHDPEKVAYWADNPVNEADLHARHRWLTYNKSFREKMSTDPDYFSGKIAGWWVWGQCLWIGRRWCPSLGSPLWRELPHLSSDQGIITVHDTKQYIAQLAKRLNKVRVCCGEWHRVLGHSVTTIHGVTGVFLDPPYSKEAGRDNTLYSVEDTSVAHKVREWAVKNGDNRHLRIALCGYEGEHKMPSNWEKVGWKAQGGMSAQRKGGNNMNKFRERIWFSPSCLGEGHFDTLV